MQQQFDLFPSHRLAAALFLAYGAAMLALLLMQLPAWALVPLYILLLFSLLLHLRQLAWLSAATAMVKLKLEGDVLELTLRDGKQLTEYFLHSGFVSPVLTILNARPRDGYWSRSIIIFSDSMDSESFRELRVRLKWAKVE